MYPFERFSESAKKVLTLAQEEAERAHHSYVGTEHLLLGLMREEDGLAGRALKDLGLQLPAIRAAIEQAPVGDERLVHAKIIPTSRVKRVIETAFEEARSDKSHTVGTGHMLLALLIEGQGIAAHVLLDQGVTVDRVKAEIQRLREAGTAEEATVRPPGSPAGPKHRHLELADSQGQVVSVDIIFPASYSDRECEAAASRIQAAIPRDPGSGEG